MPLPREELEFSEENEGRKARELKAAEAGTL